MRWGCLLVEEKKPKGQRYKIKQEIGRGAFGVVFLAHDQRLDRKVALKILVPPEDLSEKDKKHIVDRFLKEAQAAARLSHPNIVIIYDISRTKEKHYISMEYLEGQPLSDLLTAEPLPLQRSIDLAGQVLAALEFAHSHGVIHRDIKPENIFIMPDETVKLVDFGLARVIATSTLTKTGAVMGSPGYIPPEIIKGEKADRRSDIFSFGVVFYQMLSARRPFGPDSPFDTGANVVYRVISEDPDPPSFFNSLVSPQLDHIVLKCLEKERERRYQDIKGLLGDLEEVSRSESLRSVGPPMEEKAQRARGVSVLEEAFMEKVKEEPESAEAVPIRAPVEEKEPVVTAVGTGEPPETAIPPSFTVPASEPKKPVEPASPVKRNRLKSWHLVAIAVVLIAIIVVVLALLLTGGSKVEPTAEVESIDVIHADLGQNIYYDRAPLEKPLNIEIVYTATFPEDGEGTLDLIVTRDDSGEKILEQTTELQSKETGQILKQPLILTANLASIGLTISADIDVKGGSDAMEAGETLQITAAKEVRPQSVQPIPPKPQPGTPESSMPPPR